MGASVVDPPSSLGAEWPFGELSGHLVIETGRSAARVAAEIVVGEQVLGRWMRPNGERSRLAILAQRWPLMNHQS